MHIKEKTLNRIVAMLMCILLLSNFGLSVVYAVEGENIAEVSLAYGTTGTIETKNSLTPVLGTEGMDITLNLGNHTQKKAIRIIPKESAFYEISVIGVKIGSNDKSELLYELCEGAKYVSLAAMRTNNEYTLFTENALEEQTIIDVILDANKPYTLTINSDVILDEEITITLTKLGEANNYAVTNIPASVVSNKDTDYKSKALVDNQNPQHTYVEFTDNEIKNYINTIEDKEGTPEPGGFIEGILVDLIMAFGTVFVSIVEAIIGANVKLTIDNIIFNKFDQTVIDLTPLGGIQVGAGTTASGKGIFNNASVGNIIKILFDGLKVLAIIIYIVMLLYIGVKILLSIGGKNQKKFLKYLEYWITGLVLLVVLPYFLPAIPAISNAFVDLMQESARSINGNYSVSEVLERLGKDPSYLGEDAEVVVLHELIDEEIERLSQMIEDAPGTRAEAQASIDGKVDAMLSTFGDLEEGQIAELKANISMVIEFIDANFNNWTDETEKEYEDKLAAVRECMFDAYFADRDLQEEIMEIISRHLPTSSVGDSNFMDTADIHLVVKVLINTMKQSSKLYTLMYNVAKDKLESVLNTKGFSKEDYDAIIDEIEGIRNQYGLMVKFDNLDKLFKNYKDAVVQEEIDALQDMRRNVSSDVMTTLKTKAQEEHRLIYAIAWAILLYQMFAILFMYYKRVFAIIVLIVIFPLVMAFYVFDKIGDGEAQSLKNWLKEFLANIMVQVLHAAIYIILINIGIDVCNADPSKNWFFLVLTVCFLFPGERMLRGILGLSASTLGDLKNNTAATVVAVHHGVHMIRNGAKGMSNYVKNGGPKSTIENLKKEYQAEEEKQKNKKKARSDLQESKKRIRDARNEDKLAAEGARESRIQSGKATKWDKVRNKASNARKTISGFKLVEKGKHAVSAIKHTKNQIASSKLAKGLSKATNIGKIALKRGSTLAKKGLGVTAGIVEGAENFGQAGAASAFSVARRTAKNIGGFKDKDKKISKKREQQKAIAEKQIAEGRKKQYRNPTIYNNGQKVSGDPKKVTSGNINNGAPTTRTTVHTATTVNTTNNGNNSGNNA